MHEWIVCDGRAVFQSPFLMKTMGRSDHEHPLLHASFLVFQKRSSVSVVFDFNASLSAVVPVSPMPLPVDLMRMKKEWIVNEYNLCVVFFFTSQIDFCECCV